MDKLSTIIGNTDLRRFEVGLNSDKQELDESSRKIVNRLFLTFEGIFPGFKSNYGTPQGYDNAKREWTKALIAENINDVEVVKRAVNQCRLLESPFMLSIGKFISFCKSEIKVACHQDYLAIPSFKADEQVVKSELQKMKQFLGKL